MQILIIEDESRAAKRIERLLTEIDPDIEVIGTLESIKTGVSFLTENNPDIIISDIQLADGLSFEIYKQIPPTCPIIFTTAYDQYAIQAFETNGIDYLLKPIEQSRLAQALEKVTRLKPTPSLNSGQYIDIEKLLQLSTISQSAEKFKNRFMIKVGDKIKTIAIEDIHAFYSLEKGTYLQTRGQRNYVLEYSLEQIMDMVNSDFFFKINRKYIVHINAATEIIAHSNSRLKLVIPGFENESIIVAREKVQAFKAWLDQ